jgi:hypothetical protein
VDERLDAAVKRILGQNKRMAEELRVHVQETDVLQQVWPCLLVNCVRVHGCAHRGSVAAVNQHSPFHSCGLLPFAWVRFRSQLAFAV